jgi:hypothetical protein
MLYTFTHIHTHTHMYIYIYIYIPPLCSSGQSSWLQIQKSRVRFSAQGSRSFVSTIDELLDRRNSDSGLEIREYGSRNSSH